MNSAKNVQFRHLYLSTNASGVIKATQGVIHRIVVTASSSGVITLYDNATAASGTKIINALSVAAKDNFEINAQFDNGLYLSIDTGTATVTVLYT